jgi:hypothetical protein
VARGRGRRPVGYIAGEIATKMPVKPWIDANAGAAL